MRDLQEPSVFAVADRSAMCFELLDRDRASRSFVVPAKVSVQSKVVLGVIQADFDIAGRNLVPFTWDAVSLGFCCKRLEVGDFLASWWEDALALQEHVQECFEVHGFVFVAEPECAPEFTVGKCLAGSDLLSDAGAYAVLVVQNVLEWWPGIGNLAVVVAYFGIVDV